MTKDRPENTTFRLLANDLIAGGYGLRFQDGEIVHVKPVAVNMLRIGDIILLRIGAEFKAHRIIRKRGQYLITQGDAGTDPDGEIRCDQILGMVIAKEAIGSRQLVRLDGVAARLSFLASEARRRVSFLVVSRRKHGNHPADKTSIARSTST
jgi:hypothetical protein